MDDPSRRTDGAFEPVDGANAPALPPAEGTRPAPNAAEADLSRPASPAGWRRRFRRIGTMGVALLAALPVLWAGVSWRSLPVARVPAPGPERPALVFSQYAVHLGPVEPSRFVFARFRFFNRSPREVTILALEPSCGCLNPRLSRRVYAPGEGDEFLLQVDTAREEPGLHEYWCKVRYDDGTLREVMLSFSVVLPASRVRIEPPALIFTQLLDSGSSAATAELVHHVTIYDTRQPPLEILSVESTSSAVSAAVESVSLLGDGSTETRVRVVVQNSLEPGEYRGLIRLRTNDAEYGRLTVPWIVRVLDEPRTADRRPAR